ncbi:MAG: PAS domain S-box protein [Ferruginibacter sp.]|nr:PAS domain S-box protein [Chitinophagaceae bacterium]
MKALPGNNSSFSRSEERIDKLINSLGVGILFQNTRTEIFFGNTAALTILGLSEHELYGRSSLDPDWNMIQEDGAVFTEFTHPVPMAIRTKKPVSNIVMGIYRPVTNDRVWLSVNAEPLLDKNGNIEEVICSFSDISERKATEGKLIWLYQSLEQRAFELSASNTELEHLAYVATHDLQEPLRLVSSFMQLLKKKYQHQLDEQANEYIDYAVEGATRIKKLILDLLEYSKVSSNRDEFSPTDLNIVLKDVACMFSKEVQDTGAELLIPDLPVIEANPLLMGQLFEQLIGNALKYRSDCKPVIKISCKEEKDNYLFSVLDNGIGINEQYAEKIFILFRRLHNNNTIYEGTGAGLAICKKIVELHQGTIGVKPGEEKGSTFYFTIPKATKSPA